MKIISFLCLFTLISFATNLTKGGDYILDDTNKLMWQDTKDNVTILVTQEHAEKYCKNLKLSRLIDWRLPTVKEYETIIDKSRVKMELMINKAFFYAKKDDYWTSDRTWLRNFGKYGYYVFLKSGTVYYQNRSYPKYVRCVRDLKR